MKKWKKCLFLSAFLLLFLLLCGCAEADVYIGISENAQVRVRYALTFDDDGDSDASDALAQAFSDNGFTVQKGNGSLTATYVQNCSDYVEAASVLQALCTEKGLLPFTELAVSASDGLYQSAFAFDALFDASPLMADAAAMSLPHDMQKALQDGFSAQLTLSLPASTVYASSAESRIESKSAVMTQHLSMDGENRIRLTTVYAPTDTSLLSAELSRASTLAAIVGTLLLAAALLLIISALIGVKRRKHRKKSGGTGLV